MKQILATLLLASLSLTACGGSDESTEGETTESEQNFYFKYETADFSMEVPDQWEIIDSFTSEYPDELRVAFKNNVQSSIFTANVTVIRTENAHSETSYDFGQRLLADHKATLINYELISQEVISLEVGGAASKTSLSKFEGKNESSGPLLNFMQVSLTSGSEALVATATYRSGEDEFTVEELETMLKSFSVK